MVAGATIPAETQRLVAGTLLAIPELLPEAGATTWAERQLQATGPTATLPVPGVTTSGAVPSLPGRLPHEYPIVDCWLVVLCRTSGWSAPGTHKVPFEGSRRFGHA